MSAPENGTIAHNNKQTYIKTKTILAACRVWHYTPCSREVSILGLHLPFLYFFGHTLHAETSAALTPYPHPYLYPHPHIHPYPHHHVYPPPPPHPLHHPLYPIQTLGQ